MLPAIYDVTEKVVFITGAGRGIGKGIAQVWQPQGQMSCSIEIAKNTGRRVMSRCWPM